MGNHSRENTQEESVQVWFALAATYRAPGLACAGVNTLMAKDGREILAWSR